MFRLSPWSKRSAAIGSILLVMALFVACSDDDSDFATRPSDGSSSSVCEDCDDGSSSSVTPKSSSSSKVPEPVEGSSSSRHSGLDPKSSSKGDGGSEAAMTSSSAESSSSEYTRLPCDVETDENCFKDARDGQTYKMVKIGDQVWMAENLNYEVDSSFCYNDSAEYCEKYGRLYRWAAAVGKLESECGYGYRCSLPSGNIQGVCPSGWHLPSKTEWFDTVGGKSKVGKVLKSTSGWNSSGNGTDAFGFSALPAGSRLSYGGFDYEGNRAYFWSSTEDSRYRAYVMDLYYNSDYAYLDYCNKYYAFSVRCLQD